MSAKEKPRSGGTRRAVDGRGNGLQDHNEAPPSAQLPNAIQPDRGRQLRRANNAEPVVFHFTSTVFLPWILHSGVLEPTTKGALPNPLLWATGNRHGDRTAQPRRAMTVDAEFRKLHRHGQLMLIRIAFHKKLFMPWDEFKRSRKGWTPTQLSEIDWLENSAVLKWGLPVSGQDHWYVHKGQLPLSVAIAVDIKGHGQPWRPLDLSRVELLAFFDTREEKAEGWEPSSTRGVVIDGTVYASQHWPEAPPSYLKYVHPKKMPLAFPRSHFRNHQFRFDDCDAYRFDDEEDDGG